MRLGRLVRQLVFWGLPLVVLFLLIVSGFVYWLLATPTGTRWAVNTAAVHFDGESRGVEGSLWHGLRLEALTLHLPNELYVHIEQAQVQVDWPQLWEARQLHIQTLEAGLVELNMAGEATPDEANTEPFSMPQLPITVQLDRLALGALKFSQHGTALPVDLEQLNLEATAALTAEGAQLDLLSAQVGYEDMVLNLDGVAKLTELAAPWSSQVQLYARLGTDNKASQLCFMQYLPAHLQSTQAQLTHTEARLCELAAQLTWSGSLEEGRLTLKAAGQGIDVDGLATLQLSHAFPLRDTTLNVQLPDHSGAEVQLLWQRDEKDSTKDQLTGSLTATQFDLGAWLPEHPLSAKLSATANYEIQLSQSATQLDTAKFEINLAEGSQWNKQALKGHVHAAVEHVATEAAQSELWQSYQIPSSDIDVQIGANHVQVQGGFGVVDNALTLKAKLPVLSQLWPTLTDIGATEAEASLKGNLFKHALGLKAQHQLTNPERKNLAGDGPVDVSVELSGEWKPDGTAPLWHGMVQSVHAEHAGLGLGINTPFELQLSLPTEQQPLGVQVGAFALQTFVDKKPWLVIQHEKTAYGAAGLSTAGYADAITLSAQRIAELTKRLGLEEKQEQRGGVIDKRATTSTQVQDLVARLEWDVALKEALSGTVRLQRTAGDILIPAQPSFPLGLEQTELELKMIPGAGGRSMLALNARVATKSMGYLNITGSSPVYYSKEQGIQIKDSDSKEVVIDARMEDLAWTSLVLQDQLDLGGELSAQIRIKSTPTGGFTTQGTLNGQHLKITRLDDGVRLLDGSLQARIEDNRLTVDRLYFPAQLRVEPKEWRTATWIRENPEAQGGNLLLTGFWDINTSNGQFKLDLYRYPILQRADRYAMVSGEITMDATLPKMAIKGKVTADAGWFNLDMLGGIPTVDSDVVVIRSTDPVKPPTQLEEDVLDMRMSLEVDLGPRFYLTGYGVNSGLVGSMNISLIDGQLTALGALNTRGGAISMYGQRLQLRRGTVTFQGDISNPILDIQALRTGLSVEAGVKVGGTARRPKIDLISIPEVSELEKLSWLLFGHGPDDSSGDIALLLSVGTSFLGDGEPFYRKFGIDELSMRSGELGSAGSILPATSTASSTESEVSEVERRFIEVSKTLSSDITVSLRQAMSETGTVGRISYRLSRRLAAELSLGTVNGIALIYRWFSID